jgi:hypothetical protein
MCVRSWAPSEDGFGYALSGIVRILMLPHAYGHPSVRTQLSVSVSVSCAVSLDLPAPPLAVAVRPSGVIRTSVPEASVHEHRYSFAWEDDVSFAAQFTDGTKMKTETETALV